ncbi:MAG TPA: hypothetical protein VNF68_11595 [Candidatus Baltobacteraceae bacterium]|nr:hypothetical protein [Candidatus Baltobacteraceae bacterium]
MNENAQPKERLALFSEGTPNLENQRVAIFFAKTAAESGLFPDLTPEVALMKMVMAKELSLNMYEGLSGINFVEGNAELSSALMAKLLLRSGRYTYRVRTLSNERADLDFYRIVGSKYEHLGVSTFTIADAQKAGLLHKRNWQTYPRMMCFWRAMSQGISVYCPDALDGRFYVAGEIGDGPPLNPTPGSKVVSIRLEDAPITIPEEGGHTIPATAAAAGDQRPAGTVTPIDKNLRTPKAKDTDSVLALQIEKWTKLHDDFEIPQSWDEENLCGREFTTLNVGEARKILIDLNRYVRPLTKRKKSA